MGTNQYEREVLEATISASAGNGFWSAQANASFTQIMTQFLLNRRVRIYTFVNGITPLNRLARTMTNSFFPVPTLPTDPVTFDYEVIRQQFVDFGHMLVAQGTVPGEEAGGLENPLCPIRYQIGPIDALLQQPTNSVTARFEGLMEEALLTYRQLADTRRSVDDWLRAIGATAGPGSSGLASQSVGGSATVVAQPGALEPICPANELEFRLACYRNALSETMINLQEFSGRCAQVLSDRSAANPSELRPASRVALRASPCAAAAAPAPAPAPAAGSATPQQPPVFCATESLRDILDNEPDKLPVALLYSQTRVARPNFSATQLVPVVVGNRVEATFFIEGEGLTNVAVLDVQGEAANRLRRLGGPELPENQRIQTNVFIRTMTVAGTTTRRAIVWLSYDRSVGRERFPLFVQAEEFGGRQTLLPLLTAPIPP